MIDSLQEEKNILSEWTEMYRSKLVASQTRRNSSSKWKNPDQFHLSAATHVFLGAAVRSTCTGVTPLHRTNSKYLSTSCRPRSLLLSLLAQAESDALPVAIHLADLKHISHLSIAFCISPPWVVGRIQNNRGASPGKLTRPKKQNNPQC